MELAIKTLGKIGLTENEAQIYIYLARRGPCSERQLARAIGLTALQLVDRLQSLKDKGFVTSIESTCNVFSAVPLERILDSLEKSKLEEIKRLKRTKSENICTKHQNQEI